MESRNSSNVFQSLKLFKHACFNLCSVSALGLLLSTSCSTDINVSDIKFSNEEGAKVTFSAVIDENQNSGMVSSRATETNWEVGDSVGITCGDKQINVKYKYSGDEGNLFYAVNERKEIWLMGTEEYNVSAYYPYIGEDGVAQPNISVSTTTENQKDEESREKIDFLFASGVAKREQPNVQLAFQHVMSRIVLKFEAGEDLTEGLSDIDCYVTGLRLKGTFNPNTGSTAIDSTAIVESINQVLTDESNHTMTAVVLPQTLEEKLLIEAGMNGIYYQVNVDLPELKPGYSYTYTLTANDYNDNPIKLTISGTEINPWTNVDGGTLEPDPSLAGTEADITAGGWGDMTEQEVTPTEVSK